MFDKGFDYVRSLRKDLNTPERYLMNIVNNANYLVDPGMASHSETYGGDNKLLYFVRLEARINS